MRTEQRLRKNTLSGLVYRPLFSILFGGWGSNLEKRGEKIIPLVRETIKLQTLKKPDELQLEKLCSLSYRLEDSKFSSLRISHLNYLGLRAYRRQLYPKMCSQVRCKQLTSLLVNCSKPKAKNLTLIASVFEKYNPLARKHSKHVTMYFETRPKVSLMLPSLGQQALFGNPTGLGYFSWDSFYDCPRTVDWSYADEWVIL